jgi:hypothetical protein
MAAAEDGGDTALRVPKGDGASSMQHVERWEDEQ